MFEIRRSKDRGFEDKGWLQSQYTFSFDGYVNPQFTDFRTLTALNEDILAPSKGYGEQYHRDVELVTYVVEGVVEYKDSMGENSVIRAGELQRLSAGAGITESKFNLSHYQPARLFQFWFVPNRGGMIPSVQQRIFSDAVKWGQWALIVSQTGREGSLTIHQDVDLWAADLDEKDEIIFDSLVDRYYWLQVVSGRFRLMGKETVSKGDGVKITEESAIALACEEKGELLLLDLG